MNAKRILLVQAEQVERERLARQLAQSSYTVVQANNGAEAIALFRQSPFDLVVTDYEMSFFTGSELAIRLKQLAPAVPILMLSSFWQRPGPDNPVDASLHRDCQPTRLRQVIVQLLDKTNRPAEETLALGPT
jgi:CheY-like chemotaxis protein